MPRWGGDARYAALVERHGTSLLHLATLLVGNHYDAEDVVQDALIAVAAKWPGPISLSYIRRTVSNRAIDLVRVRRRFANVEVPETPRADPGLFHLEEDQAFFALVQSLPEGQRQAIVLRYYAEFRDGEIAQELGVSVQTVRSQIHRGLAKLRVNQGVEVLNS